MDASMMGQMKAIWAALDDLHDRDPEKYQKFVDTQLEEAGLNSPLSGNSTENRDPNNAKEFESCLTTLVGLKLGPQAAHKLSKDFEAAAANKPGGSETGAQSAASSSGSGPSTSGKKQRKKSNTNSKKANRGDDLSVPSAPSEPDVGYGCCRAMATQTQERYEDISEDAGKKAAAALEKFQLFSDTSDVEENEEKGDAPAKFQQYEDISDADEDAGKGDAPSAFELKLPAHVGPTQIKSDCKKGKKPMITEIH